MLPKYKVEPARPLFPKRAILRLVAFGVCLLLLVYLLHRGANPPARRVRTAAPAPEKIAAKPQPHPQLSDAQLLDVQLNSGRAVGFLAAFTMPTPCPFSVDASVAGVIYLEHVPLPAHVTPIVAEARRAPLPDPHILAGAEDRKGFLVDDPIITQFNPEDLSNERRKHDADARYHLLQLVRAARSEDLAADARRDARYTALVQKPAEYRGQLIEIEGELQWVKHFELTRQAPGLEHAFQGVIRVGGPEQGYWVLFTELPEGFPPEKEWRELYERGVKFRGYFLKVLFVEDARNKDKHYFVPVLVGKTVELPAVGVAEAWDFPIGAALGLIAGFLLVATLVVLYFRRSDRSHAARLAALRQRNPRDSQNAPVDLGPLPEFRFDDGEPHRNGTS